MSEQKIDFILWLVPSIGYPSEPKLISPPVVEFLLEYNHHPSTYHTKAALYALHYIHSMLELKINFYSTSDTKPYAKINNPFLNDKESYINAYDPTLNS